MLWRRAEVRRAAQWPGQLSIDDISEAVSRSVRVKAMTPTFLSVRSRSRAPITTEWHLTEGEGDTRVDVLGYYWWPMYGVPSRLLRGNITVQIDQYLAAIPGEPEIISVCDRCNYPIEQSRCPECGCQRGPEKNRAFDLLEWALASAAFAGMLTVCEWVFLVAIFQMTGYSFVPTILSGGTVLSGWIWLFVFNWIVGQMTSWWVLGMD